MSLEDSMFDEEPIERAVATSNLSQLIADVRRQREIAEKAKIAEACIDVFNRASDKQKEMVENYRVAKKALEAQLKELKSLTATIEAFERTCDPFPLLETMGINKAQFCRKHGIKAD